MKPGEAAAIRPASSQDFHPEAAGIVGLTTQVLTLTQTIRRLGLRAPLRKAFQGIIRSSDEITKDVETEFPEQLKADRKALDALLLRFRQLTSTAGPLGRLAVPLDASYSNLSTVAERSS